MSTPPIVLIQNPIDAACHNLLTLLARGNRELTEASNNIKSPKDIENCIKKEIALIKLLGHKITTASASIRSGYALWGIKIDSILQIVADLPIIEAWINWYKHQRSQELGLIREIEAYLPTNEDFEIIKVNLAKTGTQAKPSNRHAAQVKYHRGTHTFSVELNSYPPGTCYRIKQAEHYAKVLYNIFCAPSPPPPLGAPLPPNFNPIHYDDIPQTRSEIARSIIDPAKTFGQTLERITEVFVNTSINTGVTSELLPHMHLENPHSYLPEDHPVRLAIPSKTLE